MRINHNINALNAWRSMSETQYSMSKTLEKLSSGLRINRAGDDAAGLAISEKMRGQIKGLNMAVKNAQDAISLIQTAEGALTEVHSILQRMRELAVQAASDTNTNVDRYQIQAELDQLRAEIDRIARTTEFNTMKLLDGKIESFRPQADIKVVTGGNFALQAGLTGSVNFYGEQLAAANVTLGNNESQQIQLNLRGTQIGAMTVYVRSTQQIGSLVSAQGYSNGESATITLATLGRNFGNLVLNNIIANTTTAGNTASINFEVTINGLNAALSFETTADGASITLNTTLNGYNLQIVIRDINAGANTIQLGITTINVSLAGQAVNRIELVSGGVTAAALVTLVGNSTLNFGQRIGDLQFNFSVVDTAPGNVTVVPELRNVEVSLASNYIVSFAFQDVYEGSYVVEVGQFRGLGTSELDARVNFFDVDGLNPLSITGRFANGNQVIGDLDISGSLSASTNNFALNISVLGREKGIVFSWLTNVYNINSFGGALPIEEVIDSGVVRAEERWYQDTSLVFQIGANEGHNMLAGLDDMRAAALGLTPDSLKVTDQNSAERTIMVVDAAIHKVSSARAQLGAVQNRLEHTISNLGVAAENLTAAESRIRDADMAKEMMEFTKQQILMQSSMAMLAQANALPQTVLQLLR